MTEPDLSKARIEVLRDALKDVVDTLRALDRKTSYLININSFIFGGYILIMMQIKNISFLNYQDLIFFFPLIYLIIALFFYFFSYSPVSDPSEVLQKDDKEFGKNKFYSHYIEDRFFSAEKLSSEFFDDTKDAKSLSRVLYIEILKLSKIRERRIGLIKLGNIHFLIGAVLILLQVATLSEFSLLFIIGLIIFEIGRFFRFLLCFKY